MAVSRQEYIETRIIWITAEIERLRLLLTQNDGAELVREAGEGENRVALHDIRGIYSRMGELEGQLDMYYKELDRILGSGRVHTRPVLTVLRR